MKQTNGRSKTSAQGAQPATKSPSAHSAQVGARSGEDRASGTGRNERPSLDPALRRVFEDMDKAAGKKDKASAAVLEVLRPGFVASAAARVPATAPDPDDDREEQLEHLATVISGYRKVTGRIAFELGKAYYAAKLLDPPGGFLAWCEPLGYSKSSVEDFINIYRECYYRPEVVDAFVRPTELRVICRPRCPGDVRNKILKAGGFCGTVEQLEEYVDEAIGLREAGIDPDDPDAQKLLDQCAADFKSQAVERARFKIGQRLLAAIMPIQRDLDALVEQADIPKDSDPMRLLRRDLRFCDRIRARFE